MKNTLKLERVRLNLTQQELARQVGVSRQTINSIETCRYIPSTVLSLKLSAIFNKSVNEIFELDDKD
ncbi:putative transcriptional regulator [Dysgonomonas hofstadii]|uniref:Putative transcriptional regulator n=1 Tax=Dysgonomonas hofstadii TaxID=637886 RepID=A0A840CSF8_9BACT|nr:helix-turn-helix transcriptional regulator [Dysgonomonas hofstadii]MBB4037609.1 putative transcriptional regulator [Dysgonomonas hofstadii]